MRDDLDMARVRAFLAVVETGGVTRAAAVLGLSQAAASQQIKRLEEALDCRLFERVGPSLGGEYRNQDQWKSPHEVDNQTDCTIDSALDIARYESDSHSKNNSECRD